MGSSILFWCQPPPPAELQSHAQAPVLIRRQRVAGNAHGPHPPLVTQAKTYDHGPGQRQAVAAQLCRLPAIGPAVQLPTFGIMAQTGKGAAMGQPNVPWKGPGPMQQAQQNPEHMCPERNRQKVNRDQRQRLGCKIGRQQLPRGMPAALETLTWAGHDPESSGPCAAAQGLRTRNVP